MGWTSYTATYYKHGTVDRKAECDHEMTGHTEKYTWEVVKSQMVGATYYAAIRRTENETGNSYVFGLVCLTSVKKIKWGHDFCYKDMSEDMMPYYYDCPNSILNLLSETDNESALEWRRHCRENLERKKILQKADTVKVKFNFDLEWSDGFKLIAGDPVTLAKAKFGGSKQRSWYIPGTNKTIRSTTMSSAILC